MVPKESRIDIVGLMTLHRKAFGGYGQVAAEVVGVKRSNGRMQ